MATHSFNDEDVGREFKGYARRMDNPEKIQVRCWTRRRS